MKSYEFVIVGSGIIGLTIAHAIKSRQRYRDVEQGYLDMLAAAEPITRK